MKKLFIILAFLNANGMLFGQDLVRSGNFTLAALDVPAPKPAKYTAKASLDKKDGFYKSGETAVCTVNFLKDGKPYNGKIRSIIKWENEEIENKILECKGVPVVVKKTVTQPGWLYFGFKIVDESGKDLKGKNVYKHCMKPDIVEDVGAIFDADKLKPIAACPPDFDAYWKQCRQQLDRIPFNTQRAELKVPKKYAGKVKLYAVTLDIIENGKATGYLAVPVNAKAKSCPAFIYFLSWSWCDAPTNMILAAAAKGSIAFSATWHGLPLGKERSYYQAEGKKFRSIKGIDNRDKWIMRNVFSRVMRELDYVKSLPEWNGKKLAISGGSLGGIQAIAAAALDSAITLAIVRVPTFCGFDTKGKRWPSLPLCYHRHKIIPEWLQCTAYYDGVNFAPRIRCEIHCCTGFVDTACPPSNVMAFYNALPKKTVKSMSTNPRTGHFGTTKDVKGDKRLAEYFANAVVQQYGENEQMK
ncbi:MAG: acetylxylan esterase [Victivallales bacterium]|nr:acetylxylan esterase [Victivallales bacterium]